jgi:multisubunit Na+/H+ antiporter MnhB subunit
MAWTISLCEVIAMAWQTIPEFPLDESTCLRRFTARYTIQQHSSFALILPYLKAANMPAIPIKEAISVLGRANTSRPTTHYVPVGGITGGTIVAVMVIVFLIMSWIFYSDGKLSHSQLLENHRSREPSVVATDERSRKTIEKKKSARTKKPIRWVRVFGLAALCAVGVGFLYYCIGGSNNSNGENSTGAGDTQQQAYNMSTGPALDGGVPGWTQPSGMNQAVQDAAPDPIQGRGSS